MLFRSASGHEHGTGASILESPDDLDREQPALVGIPARNFGEQDAIGAPLANLCGLFLSRQDECLRAESVGYDQRIDADVPLTVAHESAHRGDGSGVREAWPANSVESEHVVRVPEDGHTVSQARRLEQPIEMEDRIRGVPLLSEDDRSATPLQGRQQRVFEEKGRQGSCVVVPLPFFAIVDATRIEATDPLAPAVKVQVASLLVAWCVQIADKPEVGFKARTGESLCESRESC